MSFEEVDEQLTLPRYNALQKQWTKWPPVAVIAAMYAGYKSGDKEVPKHEETTVEEMDEEMRSSLEELFGPLPVRK